MTPLHVPYCVNRGFLFDPHNNHVIQEWLYIYSCFINRKYSSKELHATPSRVSKLIKDKIWFGTQALLKILKVI